MNKRHTAIDTVCLLLVLYSCIVIGYACTYEVGVYDCSNMLGDQAAVCDAMGIEYGVAVSHEYEHVWLVFPVHDYDIHWECTTLHVIPFP